MSKPFWDAQRQGEYRQRRDEALTRRNEARDGVGAAREFDSIWARLTEDERFLLQSLALGGAATCVGSCDDPLLVGLSDHGLLARAPGVRPVLTHDLLTAFHVPAAVRNELIARFPRERAAPEGGRRVAAELRKRFGARFEMVAEEAAQAQAAPRSSE